MGGPKPRGGADSGNGGGAGVGARGVAEGGGDGVDEAPEHHLDKSDS